VSLGCIATVTEIKLTTHWSRRPTASALLPLSGAAHRGRELLPAATRRENQELKTDAPSGHGLAAALGAIGVVQPME
jgi:hypothetical protein